MRITNESIDSQTTERELRERALSLAGAHGSHLDATDSDAIVKRAEKYLVFLKAGDERP